MTDEDIPEKVDLSFLGEQLKRVLSKLGDMDVKLGEMHGSISELQVAVAAMRTDQNRANEMLEKIGQVQANNARLNVIDGQLAITEKHVGLVKA